MPPSTDVRSDAAFTLIELMVVVTILGLLAMIAVPVFLTQRVHAWDAVTESQLRNAAVAMASYYTDTGAYAAAALNPGFGYVPSAEVTLSVDSAAGDSYCIEASHVNRPAAVFSMSDGGAPAEGTCP